MAVISLRNYTREIEILIDQGKFPDAAKHCKHILKFHPKHIETYRLLGKAYLENQQYSEAADIFLRVLSVIPDDFVSQIGMSIIREDEGNLDAAIWHIERAFEVKPSNTAIQDEIRRLYGSRDGIHLSKIRLTRGALIRMYLQGELFDQAIAEARAALAEDPQRVDLEVLLARLYYQAGKKVEAAETCAQIINKLPYCLEANKIFSIILTSMDRDEEARIFQKRINALDPYAAHINKNTPSISQVPDNAILLEEMDLDLENQELSSQPAWAQTIGIEMDTQNENALPDWLPSLVEDEEISSEGGEKLSGQEEFDIEEMGMESLDLDGNNDIPDWMKSAGWQQPSESKETESDLLETHAESSDEPLDEIEQTEIPDWLKDLSPPDGIEKPAFSASAEAESLSTLIPIPGESAEDQTQDEKTLEGFAEFDEALDWLDSLTEISETSPDSVESDTDQLQDEPDEWVKEYQEGMEETSEGTIETVQSETSSSVPIMSDDEKAQSQLENEDTAAASDLQEESGELEQDDYEDTFAWLESLAAKQGVDEATLSTAAEQRNQDIPAWISELKSEETQEGTPSSETDVEPVEQKEEKPELVSGNLAPFIKDQETFEDDEIESSDTSDFEAMEPAEDEPKAEIDAFSAFDEDEIVTAAGENEIPFEIEDEPIVQTVDQPESELEIIDDHGFPSTEEDLSEITDPSEETAMLDEGTDRSDNEFIAAREALQTGEIEIATNRMSAMIHQGENLIQIIMSLDEALEDHPVDARIWQCLGDAYAQNNQVQKALEAYSKAEELLQ